MEIRANLVTLVLLTGIAWGQGSVQENPRSIPPVPIHTAEPEYTDEARLSRIEGAVLLQVEIDEKGIPTEPKVVRSLDNGLDQKAVEAVLKWRFKPGLQDGKPVSVSVKIEINFKLLR